MGGSKLFAHKIVYGFHCGGNFVVVDLVMFKLPVLIVIDYSGSAKDFQMLWCDALLNFQGIVDFVDIDHFVTINELQNL